MDSEGNQYISRAVYNSIDDVEQIVIDIAESQRIVKSLLTNEGMETEFVASRVYVTTFTIFSVLL